MSQEIIFTTLPHQKTEKEGKPYLKLSVFVSVRLKSASDATLANFDDILNWPDKILNAQFQFRLGDGTILDAELQKQKIDAALYKNIFHKDIRIKGFLQEDLTVKRINSFPMQHVKDFLFKNYIQTAVESPKKLISAENFIDESRFGVISRFKIDEKEIDKIDNPQRMRPLQVKNLMVKRNDEHIQVRNTLQTSKFIPVTKQMSPKSDFAQFRNFHRMDKDPRVTLPPKLVKPEFEFHDILSIINSYPQFMRKMGFILDFLIPQTSTLPVKGTIYLAPVSLAFTDTTTSVSVPQTAYEITANGFYTADKSDSVFTKGFVKINTEDFTVMQIDTDGAAIKTHNMVENKTHRIAQYFQTKSELSISPVFKLKDLPVVEIPEDEGLPFMRSAGIAITKNGMAEHIYKKFETNFKLQPDLIHAAPEKADINPALKLKLPVTILYSDNIIQGYRMDIAYESDPTKWYSLHQRKDTYTWYDESKGPHAVEGIEPDEGYIELGVAEDPDDKDDIFVSETLARWEGWSLAVRKPGYAINDSEEDVPESGKTEKRDFVYKSKSLEMKKYALDPDLDFKINAQSAIVPGTLPKLRFGKEYRVRIRTVDLAGNSVTLNQQSENPGITMRQNIRYMRYEPLVSPILLVGNELKDGEFLERLVIRSNFDQTTSEYENTHPVAGKKLDNFSQRYLLPPKNSQSIAETHGMFDKAFTNNTTAAQEIYNIISKHEGLYIQDVKGKEKVYQPSEVEIIYLPDPMAAGVALFIAEDCEDTHTQDFFKPHMFGYFTNDEILPDNTNVDIPEDWYNAKPVRIKLEEGELNTKWNSSQKIITIYLPKGYRTRIKFSTFWREKDFKQLSAVWEMIKDKSPSNLTELEEIARIGQHWMLSPSREFELVHAVQQPVTEPEIKALIPERDFGETSVKIHTRFAIHGESTEKVEFQAKWTDPLDDTISVTIKETQGRNSIPDITVNYQDDIITKGTIPEIPKLELKEKPLLYFQPHRDLKIQTKSEFHANPQPDALRVNTLYKTQITSYDKLQVEKTTAPKTLVNRLKFDIEESKFTFLKNIQWRIDPLIHNFGDTKHRWVDYNLVAASRYREYFDKILKQNGDLKTTRESKWVEKINILSTARPQVPQIDYIIPTFEWRKTQDKNTIRHKRLGGGLRIFLKRPWFSSGADELLGILLPPSKQEPQIQPAITAIKALDAGYTPYYTHWGIDPLHYSTTPENLSPGKNDFRMNPVFDDNVQYPDPKSIRTDVIAYPVVFDEERQQWFCDIAINPGKMYFPFVKLMLARYQPHSVRKGNDDVCLSPVVKADMIQLMPDRTATLEFKHEEKNSKFTLTIEGVIYSDILNKAEIQNYIKITLLDSRFAQPLYGVINDGVNNKKLEDEAVIIPITRKEFNENRFIVTRDFKLSGDYKTAPFQVIIQEFERGPKGYSDVEGYDDYLGQSPDTDKIVYVDVFKVNEAK